MKNGLTSLAYGIAFLGATVFTTPELMAQADTTKKNLIEIENIDTLMKKIKEKFYFPLGYQAPYEHEGLIEINGMKIWHKESLTQNPNNESNKEFRRVFYTQDKKRFIGSQTADYWRIQKGDKNGRKEIRHTFPNPGYMDDF